jgi:hypothetical protein
MLEGRLGQRASRIRRRWLRRGLVRIALRKVVWIAVAEY